MMKSFKIALRMLVVMTVLTGVVYPLLVSGIAWVAFPRQAEGSLILIDGKVQGSTLIGQSFAGPDYFWGRPSATSPVSYQGLGGSGSNQGPTNPALVEGVKGRIEKLKQADPENQLPIPVDLVTASGSGLDPHISPAGAEYQVGRVAKARNLSADQVRDRVKKHTEPATFGLLGQPRVNVLLLNLELQRMQSANRAK
ncbi:MAG: potassium-transporting ATPase subunit KdpC [Planctomycetales bacterium]